MADRLISCDDHMDLSQLPADLWATRLPASLLDRAPHVEERDETGRRAPTPRKARHGLLLCEESGCQRYTAMAL